MRRYPSDHKIWTILQHSVYLGFLTVILYLNADKFDSTEWNSIFEVGLGIAGFEVARSKLASRKDSDA